MTANFKTQQLIAALLDAQPGEHSTPVSYNLVQNLLSAHAEEEGADANYILPDGRCLLELAVRASRVVIEDASIVRELILKGADKDRKTKDGEPLVCLAGRVGAKGLMKQFIAMHADIHATDKEGWNLMRYEYVPNRLNELTERGMKASHCNNAGETLAEDLQARHKRGELNADSERYYTRTLNRYKILGAQELAIEAGSFNYTDFAKHYAEINARGETGEVEAFHDAFPYVMLSAHEAGQLALDEVLAPENINVLQGMLRSQISGKKNAGFLMDIFRNEKRAFDASTFTELLAPDRPSAIMEADHLELSGAMKAFGPYLRDNAAWDQLVPWYQNLSERITNYLQTDGGFSKVDAAAMRNRWLKSAPAQTITLAQLPHLDPDLKEDLKESGNWNRFFLEKQSQHAAEQAVQGGRL